MLPGKGPEREVPNETFGKVDSRDGSETPHTPLHGGCRPLRPLWSLHTVHHRFGVKIPGDIPLKY